MGSGVMSLCKSRASRQNVYLSISPSPAKMKVQTIPWEGSLWEPNGPWRKDTVNITSPYALCESQALSGQSGQFRSSARSFSHYLRLPEAPQSPESHPA